MRNIVLFASEDVGYEALKFMLLTKRKPKAAIVSINSSIEYNIKINSICEEYNIPVHSSDIMSELNKDVLYVYEPDLFILAWWPTKIRKDILDIPKLGTLNFHPSRLPYGRGKHPNFWAIVNDTPFGVTIHWATEKLDAGPIAFQERIKVDIDATGEYLHKKAKGSMLYLFQTALPTIWSGEIPKIEQDLDQGDYHEAIDIEDESHIYLDECYTGRYLINLLRARTYPPHPGCWFTHEGKKYEVRISITEKT